MIELDDESKFELKEQEYAKRLAESEEWKWAKKKLLTLIDAVMNLETLSEYKTATVLQNEISARKKAKGIVKTWLEEVDGLSNQLDYNKQLNINPDDYVIREEEI